MLVVQARLAGVGAGAAPGPVHEPRGLRRGHGREPAAARGGDAGGARLVPGPARDHPDTPLRVRHGQQQGQPSQL